MSKTLIVRLIKNNEISEECFEVSDSDTKETKTFPCASFQDDLTVYYPEFIYQVFLDEFDASPTKTTLKFIGEAKARIDEITCNNLKKDSDVFI